MRLHGQVARIAADPHNARSRSSRTSTIAALAILVVLAACQGDGLTAPRVGPTPPDLTLTGGVGTQIFPAVPVGEYQARGEARGLNEAGQVVGSGWVDQIADDAEAFRWSVSTGAQVIIGPCCGTKWGQDINSAGTVVGTSQISQSTGNRGFAAAPGSSATQLPILPGGDP